MMNDVTKKQLFNFFDGKSTEKEMKYIKEWSERSEENNKYFLQARKLYDLNILYKIKDNGTSIHTKDIKKENVNRKKGSFLRILLQAAAGILLIIGSSIFYNNLQMSSLESMEQTINTQIGQSINIELPDGTTVWINSNSSLKYNPLFGNKDRHIFLDGEAFFDVTKNKKIPFEVETPKGLVKVLGTQFNVKDYSKEETFETTLVEGTVQVKLKNDPSFLLLNKPNMKATLVDGILRIESIQNRDALLWKEGLLVFDDAAFDYIMSEFEKYFDYKITIENPSVYQYRYKGKFRTIDGINQVLKALQNTNQFGEFKYEQDTENRVIIIK